MSMAIKKIMIESSAGTYINDLMPELYHLCQDYHCEVITTFNGKEIIVKPKED